MFVSSSGSANYTTVNNYGYMFVSSGGIANSTTVKIGGIFCGFSFPEQRMFNSCTNITISPNVILNYNSMAVNNTGVATKIGVNSQGYMYISYGGTANSTTINYAGYMHISSGGTANSTTVNDNGFIFVSNGGTANQTTVKADGHMRVSSGGIANSTTVKIGGIFNGFSFPEQRMFNSCTNYTISPNVILNYNSITVNNTGVATKIGVNNPGYMYVSSGGTANSTTIYGGRIGDYFVWWNR